MRIIDADKLKEAVSNSPLIDFDDYDIFEVIDKCPTVTIKEWNEEMPLYIKDAMLEALRPHGEWVIDGHHYKCSRCGKTLAIMFSETDDDDLIGCPFCLADMRGGRE